MYIFTLMPTRVSESVWPIFKERCNALSDIPCDSTSLNVQGQVWFATTVWTEDHSALEREIKKAVGNEAWPNIVTRLTKENTIEKKERNPVKDYEGNGRVTYAKIITFIAATVVAFIVLCLILSGLTHVIPGTESELPEARGWALIFSLSIGIWAQKELLQ
jgi:hypothetical protein